MAKSKSGGSRAYLRGRIGSDVYSVGKDGKGKKQQVVRSLAESVKNPQTAAQMKGRAIMSTIMQAVSAMSPIIDHSFDNVPIGQPSISEFIKRNYALIKADVQAHPASGNAFGIVNYGAKSPLSGNFVIAAGGALWPAAVSVHENEVMISVSATDTYADILDKLGIGTEGYITICTLSGAGEFDFVRVSVNPSAVLTTVATAANIDDLFVKEGTVDATIAIENSSLSIQSAGSGQGAVILTQKENGSYKHSDASFEGAALLEPQAFDTAILTYPSGTEKFLNGGEV